MKDILKKDKLHYKPEPGLKRPPDPEEILGDEPPSYSKKDVIELCEIMEEECGTTKDAVTSSLYSIALSSTLDEFKDEVSKVTKDGQHDVISYRGYTLAKEFAGEIKPRVVKIFEEKEMSPWGDISMFIPDITDLLLSEVESILDLVETMAETDSSIEDLVMWLGSMRMQIFKIRKIHNLNLGYAEKDSLENYQKDIEDYQSILVKSCEDYSVKFKSLMAHTRVISESNKMAISERYSGGVLEVSDTGGLIDELLSKNSISINREISGSKYDLRNRLDFLSNNIEELNEVLSNIKLIQLSMSYLQELGGIRERDIDDIFHVEEDEWIEIDEERIRREILEREVQIEFESHTHEFGVWHNVGEPGEPPYLNTWGPADSSFHGAGFYKDEEGIVLLRGLVLQVEEDQPNIIFILPEEFRPLKDNLFCVAGSTEEFHQILVKSNGEVLYYN